MQCDGEEGEEPGAEEGVERDGGRESLLPIMFHSLLPITL